MNILKLFFLIMVACSAWGSVERSCMNVKTYVPTEKIAMENNVIWVQIGREWRPVSGLAVDSNGIYVHKDAILDFWECGRCGYVNPPWNFIACGRCGNAR